MSSNPPKKPSSAPPPERSARDTQHGAAKPSNDGSRRQRRQQENQQPRAVTALSLSTARRVCLVTVCVIGRNGEALNWGALPRLRHNREPSNWVLRDPQRRLCVPGIAFWG